MVDYISPEVMNPPAIVRTVDLDTSHFYLVEEDGIDWGVYVEPMDNTGPYPFMYNNYWQPNPDYMDFVLNTEPFDDFFFTVDDYKKQFENWVDYDDYAIGMVNGNVYLYCLHDTGLELDYDDDDSLVFKLQSDGSRESWNIKGKIYLLQVLGYGHVTERGSSGNKTYVFNLDYYFTSAERYTIGYRYVSYDTHYDSSYWTLSPDMLFYYDIDLDYDMPALGMFPTYERSSGWWVFFYDLGVYLSNLGDKAFSIFNYRIHGDILLEILVDGFLVYMGWVVFKFFVPI